jgi:hypothetical protein
MPGSELSAWQALTFKKKKKIITVGLYFHRVFRLQGSSETRFCCAHLKVAANQQQINFLAAPRLDLLQRAVNVVQLSVAATFHSNLRRERGACVLWPLTLMLVLSALVGVHVSECNENQSCEKNCAPPSVTCWYAESICLILETLECLKIIE